MALGKHRYGKNLVRVARIRREGATHHFHEVCADVMLEGDFATSYTEGDNSLVVPTDTMKNTVLALARTALGEAIEDFAQVLAAHFVEKYAQVSAAEVTLTEKVWTRLGGHAQAFAGNDSSEPWTTVRQERGAAAEVTSGLRNYFVLKTTGSGFRGFPRCEHTTLPETDDRIFGTLLNASWVFAAVPPEYLAARQTILAALLRPFAENFSPSVQTTLAEMGEAALAAVPELASIHLALPNRHYLPATLTPRGQANEGEIFIPTAEPHGQIEAFLTR